MTREMKFVEYSSLENKTIGNQSNCDDALIAKKKYLSKYNFEIDLLNGWKLKFDNYDVELNRLKLSLYNNERNKIIYSVINDLKKLLVLVRENMAVITQGTGDVTINHDEVII